MRTHQALLLFCCSALAAADLSQLRQLHQEKRIFDLWRALDQPGWDSGETLFYRGVVACRFGREAEGIAWLRKFLAAHPDAERARQANEELSSALERLGRFREAADALGEALRLTPRNDLQRGSNENSQVLLSSIGDVPPETVEMAGTEPVQMARNPLGSWNVPVRVNSTEAHWIFDTGANVSTLTESEAARLGLAVRGSKAYVGGSTGKHNPLRLAVADDLQIGAAHVHHVVFLVLADRSLYIAPIHQQIDGILGLPVLRALGRVAVSPDGVLRIRQGESVAGAVPNLFFDGNSPIVEVLHGPHRLQMFLDTGANTSELYPSFRAAMTSAEQTGLTTKKEKVGGAGGIIQRETAVVDALQIRILDRAVDLKQIHLLDTAPVGEGRYRDGVIGMDALWGGFVLDFGAMRLELQ